MLAVGLAALWGIQVEIPDKLRGFSFFFAGAFFGSTVDQETVAALPNWPVSIAGLALCLIIMLVILPRYFERVHGFDREAAFLSSIPGALSFVVAMAADRGADVRTISMAQTSRLAVLIVGIPIAMGLSGQVAGPIGAGEKIIENWGMVVLLAVCLVGWPLANILRIPAPLFSGPFFMGGILFGSGLLEGAVPQHYVWPALAILGCSIGARFAGAELTSLGRIFLAGFGATMIGMIIAACFAFPVSELLSLPFIQVLLAFAPGGIDALTILAFSLGADPAFVAGHQTLRFVGLSLFMPLIARYLDK